ncbi:hypothetical protein A2U01_0048966, partial [Trifolium medium]|nr:hypothetical protein [Trifolium medium]
KKRAVDDNNANGNASKRSKGKETVSAAAGGSGEENDDMEEDVRLTGDDSKKTFRRIFSEEDELVILKGLIDFISKTGKDPLKNIAAFHDFVKKSLHATASNQQIKRKIRGLKDKFESSDSFNKSHDKEAFELFKKISWGNNGGNVAGEENGKAVNVKSPKKDVNVKVKHIGSS